MQQLAQIAQQARYAAMLPAETAERRAPGSAVRAVPRGPRPIVLNAGADTSGGWIFGDNFAIQFPPGASQSSINFQRAHGRGRLAPWFGSERRMDQYGRPWVRDFHAVIDDFGNLVEVPPQ